MKEIINIHFDELLLVVVLIAAGILYVFRPETKDVLLGPVAGALFMALRGRVSDGNGGVKS